MYYIFVEKYTSQMEKMGLGEATRRLKRQVHASESIRISRSTLSVMVLEVKESLLITNIISLIGFAN